MESVIAHLDMDAFFASVELLRHPEFRGKPLVIGGNPKSRGVVSTCSYEARAFGVRSAMPVSQAYKLCPQAIFWQGDYSYYVEISKQVMALLKEEVPLLQVVSIDEAYLDLTRIIKKEKDAMLLAKAIREKIRKELHLPCTLGIGSSKLIAKIASKEAKPRGILQVLSGYEKEYLRPKAIQAIPGLGKSATATLNRQGIYSIGDLQKLPLLYFLHKFGSRGYWLHFSSQGIDKRKVEPTPSQRKSIGAETTFPANLSDSETLLATLDKLLLKVHNRLCRKNAFARGLTLKLRDKDFHTITRSVALPNTTQEFAILKENAHSLFLQNYQEEEIRLIGVTLERLSFGQWQPTFWDEKNE